MDQSKEHIEPLQRLAQICEHSEENFYHAAERTKNIKLKDLFNQYGEQHKSFVESLKEQIFKLGGSYDHEQGGSLAALNDLWMKIRTSLSHTKDDDKSVLHMVRSSQISVLEAYDDELQGNILETDLKHLLSYQRIEISKILHEIERLYFEQFPGAREDVEAPSF